MLIKQSLERISTCHKLRDLTAHNSPQVVVCTPQITSKSHLILQEELEKTPAILKSFNHFQSIHLAQTFGYKEESR